MTRRLGDYFVPKEEIPARVYLAVSILAGVFVIGLWCLLTYAGLVRDDFLPPPHRVIATAGKLISDGSLLKHTLASVTVILVGFILSSLVAVPIGIISGSFRVVEAFVEPIVNFTRYLPVSALIPLLILWVGIGMEEKIAVIIIGTFFQQILMVSDVSAQVPKDLLDASYTLGAIATAGDHARPPSGRAARRDRHAPRHHGSRLDLPRRRRAGRRRSRGSAT